MLMMQNDEDEEDDDEVRSELTQLTDRLRETEVTTSSVSSQLQSTDAAVEDDTKRVGRPSRYVSPVPTYCAAIHLELCNLNHNRNL